MPEKTIPVRASQTTYAPSSERRISIWSVPVDLGPWFYLLLVSHTAPLVFLLWWTNSTPKTHDNIANIIVNVTSGTAPMIFVAAVTTIIELEVLVVLREWYRDRAARKERERAEETEKRIRDAYEQGRRDERHAQTALRDGGRDNNGDQEG